MEPSHEKSTLKPQLSANVIAALQKGNKIEAIKIVRQEQRHQRIQLGRAMPHERHGQQTVEHAQTENGEDRDEQSR